MWGLIPFYGQLDSTSLSARSIQMLHTEIVLTRVQNFFFFFDPVFPVKVLCAQVYTDEA